MNKVATYHFTDKSEKRPIIYQKQLKELRDFATKFGNIEKEYLDMSLRKCDQVEKERMISEIGNYNTLVTKDFYHINKNTGTCISLLQEFLSKGVSTHSIEDGCFCFNDVPVKEPLRVATYHSKYKEDTDRSINTQLEIFNLFVKTRTNWVIVDNYVDEANSQSDTKQVKIHELIRNRENYDLVLCKDFNCIHWRTAKLCSRRNQLQLPIYSLKEGYLNY